MSNQNETAEMAAVYAQRIMELEAELKRRNEQDAKRFEQSKALQAIGKGAYDSIVDMVAALECDYDRLEELRDTGITKVTAPTEWASYLINGDASGISDAEAKEADAMVAEIGYGPPTDCEDAGFVTRPDYGSLAGDCQTYTFYDGTVWDEDTRAEYAALKEAAGECESREDVERRILEDPLSIELAGTWTLGETPAADNAYILLGTGGPATRIVCELDGNMEPRRAWIQAQDWFKPWTDYIGGDQETLLTYCRCFYFGEG